MRKMFPYIFIILFPYFILLLIYSPFNQYLKKYFLHNSIYDGLLYLCIFGLVALISSIIICINNFVNKADAAETARINMIIKIIQIPAYLFIFVIGLICLSTIFTFVISFVLLILDCLSIILSGLIGLSAVRRSYVDGFLTKKEMAIHTILQFVFCFDVVSSIIVFRKTKV